MKKLLSVILSMAMLLCVVPLGAISVMAATSGTTGDCTWTLDNGHLTISGNGAMGDYDSYYSFAPWGNSITSVTIEDGVTTIGGNAFSWCDSLTSVTIPDSVTSIGYYAFYDCDSLTSVTIPDSVTSIEHYAFRNCTSLTSVTIPDSVTSIGSYAFEYCTSLTSVTIPDSVTSIGSSAFNGTAYYNNDANWENDVLYIGNHLIAAKRTISGAYEIKPGTLTVGGDAFYDCSSLTSVTIPDSVTTIGRYAFFFCSSLTSVTIPDSVTSIGEYAFHLAAYYNNNANWENNVLYIGNHLIAAKQTISGAREIKPGTLTIAEYVFRDCDSLTSVTIPDSVTTIGRYAFSGCSSLTSVTIPDSVTTIGDSAFYDCYDLTSVTIGNSVTSIGEYAFYCCGLTSVYITDMAAWCGIDFGDHYSNPLASGANLYLNGELVTNLVIPDSVTSIGAYAFFDYYPLKSVTIPDSVTTIGDWAFYGCSSLTDVYYGGTEKDRANIAIGGYGNTKLTNATWYYAPLYGDANGDGKVNNKDLGMLQQHLNDWDVTINTDAVDVNKDGRVNNKDLGMIQQYLNDWNVTLG